MKRRKRMGMYKASATSSRDTIDGAAAHPHDVVETPAVQLHEPMQSVFESTPEKFVAFVNRIAETEARPTSIERAAGSARTLAGDRS